MQEQNPQLINNLLEQQKNTAYIKELSEDTSENQLSITRVVTAKYKVYVIILLILWVLMGTRYLPQAYQYFEATQALEEKKNKELNDLKAEIANLEQSKVQLEDLQNNKDQIIACVNEEKECSSLSEGLKSDFWSVVSYLQMGNLNSKKMKIDEKKVLKNLDQYLIKNNPREKVSSPNGVIEGIEIGEPEPVEKDSVFMKVPILIKVTFSDKDDLISFVDNIEKFIISNTEDSILYKVEELSYDMMAYEESQTTDIVLTAYYFN